MKKTQHISLVLITAALASCNRPASPDWVNANGLHHKVYVRSDSTAPYSQMHHPSSSYLWYYAFRPYGSYAHGHYRRLGYYSEAISERSNVGLSLEKSVVVRGGFGSEYSVGS